MTPSKESLQAARALIPHIESGTVRRYASRLADDGPIVTLMAEAIDTAYAEKWERVKRLVEAVESVGELPSLVSASEEHVKHEERKRLNNRVGQILTELQTALAAVKEPHDPVA